MLLNAERADLRVRDYGDQVDDDAAGRHVYVELLVDRFIRSARRCEDVEVRENGCPLMLTLKTRCPAAVQ